MYTNAPHVIVVAQHGLAILGRRDERRLRLPDYKIEVYRNGHANRTTAAPAPTMLTLPSTRSNYSLMIFA